MNSKCQFCGTSYETNCSCGENDKHTVEERRKMFNKDCERANGWLQEIAEQWVIDSDPEIKRKADVIWELGTMIRRMSQV